MTPREMGACTLAFKKNKYYVHYFHLCTEEPSLTIESPVNPIML